MSVGRCLAYCAYPVPAWYRLTARGRSLLVAAYFTAGYLLTLGTLLLS